VLMATLLNGRSGIFVLASLLERVWLIIYSVAYVDGSRGRIPVAHRLSFVEMVVPYIHITEKMPLMQGKMALEKMHSLLRRFRFFIHYISILTSSITPFSCISIL